MSRRRIVRRPWALPGLQPCFRLGWQGDFWRQQGNWRAAPRLVLYCTHIVGREGEGCEQGKPLSDSRMASPRMASTCAA
eukprot:3352389-Amphidinium_carterae.2